jgi:hypothetical protein
MIRDAAAPAPGHDAHGATTDAGTAPDGVGSGTRRLGDARTGSSSGRDKVVL